MTRQGFTLIEVMIASAIFVVVVGISLLFTTSAVKQTELNNVDAAAQLGLLRIQSAIMTDLANSAPMYDPNGMGGGELVRFNPMTPNAPDFQGDTLRQDTLGGDLPRPIPNTEIPKPLDPGNTGAIIRFRVVTPPMYYTDQRTNVWSQPIRYELRLTRGENTNGLDDNGNGLIDEYQVTRIDDNPRPGQGPPPYDEQIGTGVYFADPTHIEFTRDPTGPLIHIKLYYFTNAEELQAYRKEKATGHSGLYELHQFQFEVAMAGLGI